MELQEFTENAIKTESLIDNVVVSEEVLVEALTAFIASAQILDMLKKNVFYGKPFDDDKLIDSAMLLEESSDTLSGLLISEYDFGIDQCKPDTLKIDPRVFHSIIGICTESGELGELLLKCINTGAFDTVNFGEELGDIDWYKAIGTDATNLDPANVLDTVIKKLQKRYPDKFTSKDAIDRDVASERELLEDKLEYPADHWKQPY